MAKGMGSGWHFESRRHSLASRGIHTGSGVSRMMMMGKDSDRDGVPDSMDCAPHDFHRQHTITRYSGDISASQMAEELKAKMTELGYDADIRAEGNRIIFRQVRLSDKFIEEKGYNLSPYTNRRGRILGWDNWVEVNDGINEVMDKFHASANIKSLGGKFVVRTGTHASTEDDWSDMSYENVGSMVRPVDRRYAWESEGIPRPKKAPRILKYRTSLVLQGNYGHGWEDLTAEDNWSEIRQRAKEYRENEQGTNFRIVRKKELNPDYLANPVPSKKAWYE